MITEKLLQTTLETLQTSLNFTQATDTIKVIYNSLLSKKNLVLYGPGGYGKSEILQAVFQYLNIPYHVIYGHRQMSVEELLGIPDMKKLMEESEYIIKFENTVFAQHGVLIIEEATDIPAEVITCLKDIITSKGYRYKDQLIPMNISTIYLTGNTNPETLAKDDATKAFFNERFPLQQEVKWKDYSYTSYMELWNTIYNNDCLTENKTALQWLARACALNKEKVSPRAAVDYAHLLLTVGVCSLEDTKLDLAGELKKELEFIQQLEKERTTQQLVYEQWINIGDEQKELIFLQNHLQNKYLVLNNSTLFNNMQERFDVLTQDQHPSVPS